MREHVEQVDLVIFGGDARTMEELERYGVNVMMCPSRSPEEISGTRVVTAEEGVDCSARMGVTQVRIESER